MCWKTAPPRITPRFLISIGLPVKPELENTVLLPILGDQYGIVLENQEIVLQYDDGQLFLQYYEHRLPLDPSTWNDCSNLPSRGPGYYTWGIISGSPRIPKHRDRAYLICLYEQTQIQIASQNATEKRRSFVVDSQLSSRRYMNHSSMFFSDSLASASTAAKTLRKASIF